MTLLTSESLPFVDNKRISATLILLLLELFIKGSKSAGTSEIENHLELGREMLTRGQLSDALTHYHAAVEGDPNNYLTFFKRGTVFLALGKARFALQDFSRVLELKPDFTSARLQRGSIYFKIGDYEKALVDFEMILKDDPYNPIVNEQNNRIPAALDQWAIIKTREEMSDYQTVIHLVTQLLELSPMSVEFRKSRANAYIQENDILSAISDLRSVNKLTQDSTDGYFQIAQLLYDIGDATSALKEIRECLKLDPEHKHCFPFYKKLKKIEKALSNAESFRDEKKYADCVASAEIVLKHEKSVQMIIFGAKQVICSCLTKDEEYARAIKVCTEAINIFKDPNVLCDRAEAHIGAELYEDAIKDYHAAVELDEHLQKAKEGIEKAKRLQKQSEKRDYYKILGVKRNASKQEIVKAYRKAAQKWHPDNFRDDDKKLAEKKFIDIAAAKEVLTDPEKRRQFDAGEDPLDPEAGRGNGFGGGSPFAHFHHGSPFQFKFHFN